LTASRRTENLPDLGKDPVDAVQRMLHAVPITGTQVVQLSAQSSHQELVSDLVNTVAAVLPQANRRRIQGSGGKTPMPMSAMKPRIFATRC